MKDYFFKYPVHKTRILWRMEGTYRKSFEMIVILQKQFYLMMKYTVRVNKLRILSGTSKRRTACEYIS
jgi:hypothetical protein